MSGKCFFFAGGGTGGHIYPAVAVAEKVIALEPAAKIHFFCSTRSIDARILEKAGFEFTRLPAKGLCVRPSQFVKFCASFAKSSRLAKAAMAASDNPAVVGVGGFVAAPVCWAGHKLKIPVALLNVDIVPGRANKMIARWADEIFVQFADTQTCFAQNKARIHVVGCPLRSEFQNLQPTKALEELGLDRNKKTLLITGASSGSENINEAVCSLLAKLDSFADDWQIVHLTGHAHYEKVRQMYSATKIAHNVLAYFDDMPNLLAAADLVVGRSGAVSVAEYAAACVPSICMPYPYHRDRHQYLNAGKLVEAGAAVIVKDLPELQERAGWLWEELQELMSDEEKRREMADACKRVARLDASSKIAERLLRIMF
jgi:UDP-N-acetylglucosamine--N-acetylmuramyl-(pentapeptide) pyrophosphoryl-undecaprenol N-acetylglucosamine transferase